MERSQQTELSLPQDAISEQLRRLCESSLFSHSRRYPIFLDYVVRKTLSGHQEDLKERIIGIEAFGRPAEYDLNADPIVRITAGEVRRRLAQYYYDPLHRNELRIELRPGSYIPEFQLPSAPAIDVETSAPKSAEDTAPAERAHQLVESKAETLRHFRGPRVALWSGVATAFALALVLTFQIRNNSLYDQLWRPVVKSPGPVLIVVGSVAVLNPPAQPSEPTPDSVGLHPLYAAPVALADMIAASNIEETLANFSKLSVIQSSKETTYSDLQKGSLVLISGFDNSWTMRLTDPLRFHFVQPAVDIYEIADRTDPVHKAWPINTRDKFDRVTHDYGLVARFHDPTTEQTVVVAAGIGEDGTLAASKLLCEKKYLKDLANIGLFTKSDRNWEAVIETSMIDGKPGPPHVVASYSW